MVAELQRFARPLTLEDLETTPEDGRRFEVLQGELVVSPSPGDMHQVISARLHLLLAAANQASHFGCVRYAPRYVRLTPNDIVVPDLLGCRKSQRQQATERFFEGAPAFVIEIISPWSRTYDEVRKASLYINSGVEEYWVVDPERAHVLVHLATRIGANPQIFTGGSFDSAIMPGLRVVLTDLFAPDED